MNLKTILLDYQKKPVKKLLPIKVGCLFMDMGTGKTRVCIELVYLRRKKIKNVIWFCPVSLKETINYEINKHSSGENIYMFGNKTNSQTIPSDSFWYIIGIESMSSSARTILATLNIVGEDSFVVVDESSYIKGHKSNRTKWITDISKVARYRIVLTGTPISQGVIDLYSQLRFLSPKILGYNSFYAFAANHLEYSEKYPGLIVKSHNTEYIAAKIKPYVYQIKKNECLDLPDKLYESCCFSMTDEQRCYYEMAKNEILMNIEYDKFESYTIFRLFTALQQITSGFWNRKDEIKNKFNLIEFEHTRIQTFMDIIEKIPDNEKIIIWAKFHYDINSIARELSKTYGAGSVCQHHGKIPPLKRSKEIEQFRDKARFFIGSPSSGGFGLTLNEASYTIYYNNNFKYQIREQSEDRNHRIGQKKAVTYIDITCVDSIDERICNALEKKENAVTDFRNQVERVKDDKIKLSDYIRNL